MCKRTLGLLFSLWAMIATAQASDGPDQLQNKAAANFDATASDVAAVAKVLMSEPATKAGLCLCGGTDIQCVGTVSATALWAVPTLSVISLNGWTPHLINSVTSFAVGSLSAPDPMRLLSSCLNDTNQVAATEIKDFCWQPGKNILNHTLPFIREPFDSKAKSPDPGAFGMSLTF